MHISDLIFVLQPLFTEVTAGGGGGGGDEGCIVSYPSEITLDCGI